MAEIPNLKSILTRSTTTIFPFLTHEKNVLKIHFHKLALTYHPDKMTPELKLMLTAHNNKRGEEIECSHVFDLIKIAYDDYCAFIDSIPKSGNSTQFCACCRGDIKEYERMLSINHCTFHLKCWTEYGMQITIGSLTVNDFSAFFEFLSCLKEKDQAMAYLAYIDKQLLTGCSSIIDDMLDFFSDDRLQKRAVCEKVKLYIVDKMKQGQIKVDEIYKKTLNMRTNINRMSKYALTIAVKFDITKFNIAELEDWINRNYIKKSSVIKAYSSAGIKTQDVYGFVSKLFKQMNKADESRNEFQKVVVYYIDQVFDREGYQIAIAKLYDYFDCSSSSGSNEITNYLIRKITDLVITSKQLFDETLLYMNTNNKFICKRVCYCVLILKITDFTVEELRNLATNSIINSYITNMVITKELCQSKELTDEYYSLIEELLYNEKRKPKFDEYHFGNSIEECCRNLAINGHLKYAMSLAKTFIAVDRLFNIYEQITYNIGTCGQIQEAFDILQSCGQYAMYLKNYSEQMQDEKIDRAYVNLMNQAKQFGNDRFVNIIEQTLKGRALYRKHEQKRNFKKGWI